ncbi:DUF1513 domain-containing protein [Vibrio sp. HN007]|uniref:DUF1513 domain-containing protein n=1 Tax=Vibrio iocasae TaxID=3098914 RepID=UPI0035D40CE5
MQPMVTDLTRRNLLKAALLSSTGLSTLSSDAFASVKQQSPTLIGCSVQGKGRYSAVVADKTGVPIFKLPIPDRGHGVAVCQKRALAVVFARRPGSYFQPFNFITGEELALKVAEPGRHYYGHGAFSNDGKWLYTTEGDVTSNGLIGVYDVDDNFKKVDEFSGFGIGPHELIVLQDDTIVVGVGGVQTDGRKPTNLESMKPSLSYLDKTGRLIEQVGLDDHKLSIRHLSTFKGIAAKDEFVVCGQQYRGEPDDFPSLIGIHRRGEPIQLLNAEPEEWARFNHYIASVAVIGDHLLATSPRGNCYGIWSVSKNRLLELDFLPDASGVVSLNNQFVVSSGSGKVVVRDANKIEYKINSGIQWDNHWSSIS